MTGRVSTNMAASGVQANLRRQETKVNKSNNLMGSNSRIQELRDDPIAAGHLVRYQSYLTRMNTFEDNAKTLSDTFAIREGYMNSSLDMMQRIREIAVTGANGTYQKDDLRNMAGEVDQMLQQLVQNANAIDPNGNSVFAGTNVKSTAFDVDMGNVEGAVMPVITGVRYNGNVETNNVEIDEHKYMVNDNIGNRTFWAEKQILFSERDATAWQAAADSVICVDGVSISVNAGDNVYALSAKINDSGVAVKASIDPVTGGLNLATTDTRQLWLEDINGSVLRDIGIIKDNSQRPPYNLGDSVRVSGGSLFDTVIALRDAMLSGDAESIGGRVLGSLDSAINNLVARLAESGSEYERAQQNMLRNSATALNTAKLISQEGDLDFTKAITDMKMLEYVYQATLSTAGKMYQNTLLNYMR